MKCLKESCPYHEKPQRLGSVYVNVAGKANYANITAKKKKFNVLVVVLHMGFITINS